MHAWGEGHLDLEAGVSRRLLDGRAAAQHDQVGQRDALAADGLRLELLPDRLQRAQHLPQLGGLIDGPPDLRLQADPCAVGAAALVGAAERRRRGPGGGDELRHRESGAEDLALEGCDVLRSDQRMGDRGDRVLPDLRLGRHQGAEVARERSHVPVRELEPRFGERVGELLRVLEEAP